MVTSGKKILFISHEASRSGAPIFLLNFLKWFKANTNIPFEVLIINGVKRRGALVDEFRRLARVTVIIKKEKALTRVFINRMRLNQLHHIIVKKAIETALRPKDFGLIYINSIDSGSCLYLLSSFECPVLTHLHEMEYYMRDDYRQALDLVIKRSYHYIAVSEAVKTNFIFNCSVHPDKIDVLYGSIPFDIKKSEMPNKRNLRADLDIPSDAIIAGACGSVSFRKGADLFLQIAAKTASLDKLRRYDFVWIGPGRESFYPKALDYDIRMLGIRERVHFTGEITDPSPYMRGFDIYLSPSRTDPFPLTVLEAAALAKPILCFEKSGGVNEFIDGCGYSVPYLDVDKMARAVIELGQDPDKRKRFGESACAKALRNHNMDNEAKKIAAVINRFYK